MGLPPFSPSGLQAPLSLVLPLSRASPPSALHFFFLLLVPQACSHDPLWLTSEEEVNAYKRPPDSEAHLPPPPFLRPAAMSPCLCWQRRRSMRTSAHPTARATCAASCGSCTCTCRVSGGRQVWLMHMLTCTCRVRGEKRGSGGEHAHAPEGGGERQGLGLGTGFIIVVSPAVVGATPFVCACD